MVATDNLLRPLLNRFTSGQIEKSVSSNDRGLVFKSKLCEPVFELWSRIRAEDGPLQ